MRRFVLPLLFLLLLTSGVDAAPMPPQPVINHQTRQCAVIVPGDECGDVILPPGWENLDEAAGETCPSDYTTIDLHPEWARFKVEHCCMEGHSGVGGDCQDVIIRQSKKQCAFVEDIQSCAGLPDGWEAWGENCPKGFEWVEAVVCTGGSLNPTALPTSPQKIEPSRTPPPGGSTGGGRLSTAVPTPSAEKRNPMLPCSSLGMVLVAVVGAIIKFGRPDRNRS